MKETVVLGIETACDDTAAAVVIDGHQILSNVIWTQNDVHKKFEGIVPELAARRHMEVMNYVIHEAITKANISFNDIDAVGVNCRHGLLRSIIIGVSAAKALSLSLSKPLIGIHHIEGHIYSNIIGNPNIEFPHICLTVAGGHTLLINVINHGEYFLLGSTLDDGAGEAFDKVAKYLGLGFPGGRIIDELSAKGNPAAIKFPRPLLDKDNYDFSFSGLKTAVKNEINTRKNLHNELYVPDIAASFQQAVIDVLVSKTIRAAQKIGVKAIAISGGVAANRQLREDLTKAGINIGVKVYSPPLSLCTDNGAMVASLAFYKLKNGKTSSHHLDARASSPLSEEGLKRPVTSRDTG